MPATELYTRYRPSTLDEVVGQEEAVRQLTEHAAQGTTPHALMFTGPPGTGKTTMARIVARRTLGCARTEFVQVNCGGLDKPLETIRGILRTVRQRPLAGPARVWLLDEVQSLSRARFAQEGLLGVLEEQPEWVYFMLATTDPKKVLATVRSRCTTIECRALTDAELGELIDKVTKAEKQTTPDVVKKKIVEMALGSARNALVYLQQTFGAPGTEGKLGAILPVGTERAAFDLVKALIPFRGGPNWADVASVLRAIEKEEPEKLRNMVLTVARGMLLKGGPSADRAYLLICEFEGNFYDGRHASLARACYAVARGK
jgi:DNA polymerase III subunit gamma/tau